MWVNIGLSKSTVAPPL